MTAAFLSSIPSKTERPDAAIFGSTHLYIAPGVIIKGDIHFEAQKPDQRLVIRGEVEGNISTSGVLEIAEGAIVRGNTLIDCAEIVVAGRVVGDNVTIKARLLRMLATSNIAVEKLCLPPGCLEQSRGGVLNAQLDMSEEHGAPAIVVDSAANVPETSPTRISSALASVHSDGVSIKPDADAAKTYDFAMVSPNFAERSKSPNMEIPGEGA